VALNLRRSASWIGVASMVVVAWPFAFIGLVAPAWMVPVMVAAWALMLALALRNFTRRPMLVLVMPVIALAFWVAVVSAGGAWFGWTA
jgi:hypothetical protein